MKTTIKFQYLVECEHGKFTFSNKKTAETFCTLMAARNDPDCPYIGTDTLAKLAISIDNVMQQEEKEDEALRLSKICELQTESQHPPIRPAQDGQDSASGHCGQDTRAEENLLARRRERSGDSTAYGADARRDGEDNPLSNP